ncbi:UDP-N-acetylmuramate dehydrogenase [Flocculibacter collagenilyticus]|uniref:UDP-N-acetylmuramate dehydrogenase n=1 Tax=Flocculibacter collagenilyticus TaxID=2744479 RepID=UPI0018F67F3C|nr:UDP-N-acetylmuramate dehydrogenase [Flocculibacter collagenilyticus]
MISLKHLHTFALNHHALAVHQISHTSDLSQLTKKLSSNEPYWLLGQGSNCLFIDDFMGAVVAMKTHAIEIEEYSNHYAVCCEAGVNWHQLVTELLRKGINGLENLALIPGTVGAAPMQNIGAYGAELSEFVDWVEYFDLSTQSFIRISNQECQFSYRDSVFKHELRHDVIISRVMLKLSKQWQPKKYYGELKLLPENCSAEQVYNKVIEIRQKKIPDPTAIPNAGSFFKNPIVTKQYAQELAKSFPTMPCYPVDESHTKLAAGWLIDQAGLKGMFIGGAMVHQNQALVLINHQHASGKDVINLAMSIREQVLHKFGVLLEPEVRLVGQSGEVKLAAVSSSHSLTANAKCEGE